MTHPYLESLRSSVRYLSPNDLRTLPFRPADVAHALTWKQLDTLARLGHVQRIRHGWYCAEPVHPVLRRAARLGGVVTCTSALALWGAWNTDNRLHLRLRRGRTESDDLVLHCDNRSPMSAVVEDPLPALLLACRCLDPEQLTLVTDSVLNHGLISAAEYEHLLGSLSRRLRHKLRFVDGRSESGTESRVRYWLQSLGFHVQPQAYFPGVGRVDLMVNGKVIECDSVAHHGGEQHFRDRERDLKLGARSIPVHRLSHRQVMHQWPATQQYLLAILGRPQRRGKRISVTKLVAEGPITPPRGQFDDRNPGITRPEADRWA